MAMQKVNTRLIAAIFSVMTTTSQKELLVSTRIQLSKPTHWVKLPALSVRAKERTMALMNG